MSASGGKSTTSGGGFVSIPCASRAAFFALPSAIPETFGPRLRESITAVTITRVAVAVSGGRPPFPTCGGGRSDRRSSTGTYVLTNCFVSNSTRAH